MSIPLDRLYHHLENFCDDDTIIYRWHPHGSKKLKDLTVFKDYCQIDRAILNLSPIIIFHDQEPLGYDRYAPNEISTVQEKQISDHLFGGVPGVQDMFLDMPIFRTATLNPLTVYDKLMLCHSEKNSKELQKFEHNGFIGIYYWAHAVIARDWFRYAEHDPALTQHTDYKYDFLIYNRAWTGTREYRLKFCEMLVESNLINCCKTSFAPDDNGINYTQYVFQNPKFELKNRNLESHFEKNTTTSCFSADYTSDDYAQCGLEVVLETLFDDERSHLTEKSLRPIACNKPFILAATPFSLEYLRSYGFKTFNGLIDETYDTIVDPLKRLETILKEIKRLSCLPQANKQELWEKLNVIAAYNRQLFFSNQWHESIVNEFKENLNHAKEIAKKHRTGKYMRELYRQLDLNQITHQSEARKIVDKWLADNGYTY